VRLRKRRDAHALGLTFVAFDLLWLDGNQSHLELTAARPGGGAPGRARLGD
jgi:hypothetical protein